MTQCSLSHCNGQREWTGRRGKEWKGNSSSGGDILGGEVGWVKLLQRDGECGDKKETVNVGIERIAVKKWEVIGKRTRETISEI